MKCPEQARHVRKRFGSKPDDMSVSPCEFTVRRPASCWFELRANNKQPLKKMMVILERVEPHDMEVMVAEGYAWRISQLIHLPSVRIKQ
jgi:hypothetical protein